MDRLTPYTQRWLLCFFMSISMIHISWSQPAPITCTVSVENLKPLVYTDSVGDLRGVYVSLMDSVFQHTDMTYRLSLHTDADILEDSFTVGILPYFLMSQLDKDNFDPRVLYTSTYGSMSKSGNTMTLSALSQNTISVPNKAYFINVMHSLSYPIDTTRVQQYTDLDSAIVQLQTGRCDVILADFRILSWYRSTGLVKNVTINQLNGMPYIYYFVTTKAKCSHLTSIIEKNIENLRRNGTVGKLFDTYLHNPYQHRYDQALNNIFISIGIWALVVIALIWTVKFFLRLRNRERKIFSEFTGLLMNLPHGTAIFKAGQSKPILNNDVYDYYQSKQAAGDVIHLSEHWSYFEYDYKPYSVVLQLDITSLEVARSKSKKSALMKRRFLDNATQGLKVPLNEIVQSAAKIVSEEDEKKLRTYADVVEDNTHKLLHLIDDILNLSQLQADASKNRKARKYDFYEVINYLQTEFADHLESNTSVGHAGLHITSNFTTLESNVDPSRVRRVMKDLISHALRRSESGPVHVHFDFVLEDRRIDIVIEDDSPVIPPEDIAQLFNPSLGHHYSIDSSYLLALNIAYAIIDHIGGTIQVESEQGKGTKISISSKSNHIVHYK